MMNIKVLAEPCRLLAQITSPQVVGRHLVAVGFPENVLNSSPFFVPYSMQAILLESMARELGVPNLGALVGRKYNYRGLGLYADYVLGAATLGDALRRAILALPFIQTGSIVGLRELPEYIVLEFGSGVHSIVGARHIEEGILFLMINLIREFKGENWNPKWCELPNHSKMFSRSLDGYFETPVKYGANMPGIAIVKQDLEAPNPNQSSAQTACLFRDLRPLVPNGFPGKLKKNVRNMIDLELMIGNVSLDTISAKLNIGSRSLQRGLQIEGTTFREILNYARTQRACGLLCETDFTIDDIASALGYDEVNSFRRSFQKRFGVTPTQYREQM